MKIRLFSALGLVIVFFTIIIISCRKIETEKGFKRDARIITSDFFQRHIPSDPLTKSLLDFIKKKNDTLHFVEKTVERIGYPRWDKANSFSGKTNKYGGRAGADSNSITITFIPFVRDSQNYVNALMAIRTTASDTSFRYLCDWQYTDTAAIGMETDAFAFFMMKMDKSVFGHNNFRITDSSIFNGWPYAPDAVRLIDSLPQTVSNLVTPIYYEICFISYGPEYPCGQVEGCVPGQSSASCFKYCRDEIGRSCFTGVIWEDDDYGGGGTGTGGSGSGGSGGGGNPPEEGTPSDCDEGGLSGRNFDPCGPGWEPIPIEDEPQPQSPLPNQSYREPAEFGGVRTYITPSGIPFTLPEGSKVLMYNNIDLRRYPNGALYAFELANGDKYLAIQEEELLSGAIIAPAPKYRGYFKITPQNTVDFSSPFTGFVKPEPQNGLIKAVRISKTPTANGGCNAVREIVYYQPNSDYPNANPGAYGEVSYEVEMYDVDSAIPTETVLLSECNSSGNPNYTIQDFLNTEAQSLVNFLNNRLQNTVKVYLFDCNSNTVTQTITRNGIVQVSASDQTIQAQQYSSGTFSETIAIKGCLTNGLWQYDIKFNPSILTASNVHPKVQQHLNEVVSEIRRQANDEARVLTKPGERRGGETINADNGERFYKANMSLFESLAAIYDVGEHIISEGQMPEYIWDQGRRSSGQDMNIKANYTRSPFNMPSVISGGCDQLIDEVTGVVQLVKMGLEAIRRPRATFDNIYKAVRTLDKEKIKQILSSVSGIDNYNSGGDRAVYQGGRHSVQAAMIFFTSVKALTNGTKTVREAGEEITEVQKFLPDGFANSPAGNALKNAAENNILVKNINNDKLLTKNLVNGEEKYIGIEKNSQGFGVYEAKQADFVDENGNILSDASIKEALEEGAKDVDLPLNTNNSYKRGQRGGWNKELNKFPLISNKIYDVDGFKFHTDIEGRVTKVEIATLQRSIPPRDRNKYQQSLKCNKAKDGVIGQDQGGHLLGAQFGGPGEQINLVPMRKTLNQSPGTWAQMEQEWTNILNNGGSVSNVQINISYGPNGRPTGFNVIATVNGNVTNYPHSN